MKLSDRCPSLSKKGELPKESYISYERVGCFLHHFNIVPSHTYFFWMLPLLSRHTRTYSKRTAFQNDCWWNFDSTRKWPAMNVICLLYPKILMRPLFCMRLFQIFQIGVTPPPLPRKSQIHHLLCIFDKNWKTTFYIFTNNNWDLPIIIFEPLYTSYHFVGASLPEPEYFGIGTQANWFLGNYWLMFLNFSNVPTQKFWKINIYCSFFESFWYGIPMCCSPVIFIFIFTSTLLM